MSTGGGGKHRNRGRAILERHGGHFRLFDGELSARLVARWGRRRNALQTKERVARVRLHLAWKVLGPGRGGRPYREGGEALGWRGARCGGRRVDNGSRLGQAGAGLPRGGAAAGWVWEGEQGCQVVACTRRPGMWGGGVREGTRRCRGRAAGLTEAAIVDGFWRGRVGLAWVGRRGWERGVRRGRVGLRRCGRGSRAPTTCLGTGGRRGKEGEQGSENRRRMFCLFCYLGLQEAETQLRSWHWYPGLPRKRNRGERWAMGWAPPAEAA